MSVLYTIILFCQYIFRLLLLRLYVVRYEDCCRNSSRSRVFYFYEFVVVGLEEGAVVGDDCFSFGVGIVDDAADFGVDLGGDALGQSPTFDASTKEYATSRSFERDGPEGFTHTIASDHIACECGEYLEIVTGASGDVAKDFLFGDIATERDGDVVEERVTCMHLLILEREMEGVARSASAADDGHFMNRISVWQE